MAKYIEIATLHPQVLDENTTIARHSAFYMAKYTYDILKMKGEKAIYDLKKGQWTKDLHDVIYVNIALTGIVSALMQGKGQTGIYQKMASWRRSCSWNASATCVQR